MGQSQWFASHKWVSSLWSAESSPSQGTMLEISVFTLANSYPSDRHKATFSWQWVWHATRVRGWNWSSDVAVMSYAHSASGELQLELFFFAENSCLVLLETMCVRMEKQNNELKDAKSWGNAEGNLVNINSLWELKTTLLKIPLTLQVAIWSTLKQRY